MKRLFVIAMLIALAQSVAWAKRIPPAKVDAVVHEGVKYVVPNDSGRNGYVQACDVETGEKLWEKTIFKVRINTSLEEDVQWVFIESMELLDGTLLITDERGRRYSLDPKTQKVKKLKKKENPDKSGQQ